MLVTQPEQIDKYYRALLERNQQFVGIFYVGVKTTGIFCIATCTARKPKLHNVTFYTELNDALQQGFRPCKVCRPTEQAGNPPHEVKRAIELFKSNPQQKVLDSDLRAQGIAPENIRRWFKKNYGITYQHYQRMTRMNMAYQDLKNGQEVTDSAYDSGYESLSGFGYMFKKTLGVAPKNSRDKTLVRIERLATPLGPMFVCATEQGICLLEFTDRRLLEAELADLQKRLNAQIITGENAHIVQLRQELAEYFAGTRQHFTVALHTPTTPFRQRVWDELLRIPYGQTRSYQAQAQQLGNPQAVRAVASANGQNRIAIVIPCHRVIGKDGDLVGYAGGLDRKRWLLEHEQKHRKP